MRIISGIYGGRRLSPPKNITARPTTDFAKESLFNVIGNRMDLEGTDVLDLFAGTGSIGIECASRGAREVTSVELAHVQENWILSRCKQLIFADPPYALETLATLPDRVLEQGILREGGMFVLEHGKDNNFAAHPRFVEERKYGNVHFSIFE